MLSSKLSLIVGVNLLLWLGHQVQASHVKFDLHRGKRSTHNLARRAENLTVPLIEASDHTFYHINIGVGTPPQPLALQLDTGSSDIWIPAAGVAYCKKGACDAFGTYNSSKSSTYQLKSNGTFSAAYGTGGALGDFITDTLTVGDFEVPQQTLGLALKVLPGTGTPIFGVAFDSLEASAKSYGAGAEFPTFIDGLVSSKAIERRAFSLYLDDQEAGQGAIIFGGIDHSRYTGELITLPIAKNDSGAYDRYRVDLTSVSVDGADGNKTVLSPSNMSTPAILDSGVTTLLLPGTITTAIAKGLGAVLVDGVYFTDCSLRNSKANITFQFGGSAGPLIAMPLNQLLGEPFNLNFTSGAPACEVLLYAGDASDALSPSIGGYSLGDPFLRNAYVVYDIDNKEISLAQAAYNVSGSGNIQEIPAGTGLSGVSKTVSGTPTVLPIVTKSSGSGSGTATASSAANTAVPTVISATPGKPTFDVGSTATATGSGSGSSSSSAASGRTFESGSVSMVAAAMVVFAIYTGW